MTELRLARVDDVGLVTDYYFATWRVNLAHLFSTGALNKIPDGVRRDRHAVFESWLAPGANVEVMVATRDDQPIAHAAVRGDELLHLFVDPAVQGSGSGDALLRWAEDRIRQQHETARLFTLVGNDRAVDFYVARGWETTDVRVDATYFGEPQVEQLLTKSL